VSWQAPYIDYEDLDHEIGLADHCHDPLAMDLNAHHSLLRIHLLISDKENRAYQEELISQDYDFLLALTEVIVEDRI